MIQFHTWLCDLCYDLSNYPPFYFALPLFTFALIVFGRSLGMY